MKVVALRFYENGEMKESFALGGSMEAEKVNQEKKYPASLQNYLIDTGEEVILVDTGLPIETTDFEKKEDQPLYMGEKVANYLEALEIAGYKPEQISKIIITHKHPDHSGELRSFPKAKVYISRNEAEAMKIEQNDNVIPVDFTEGAFENFAQSQKIVEGLYMLPAYGHTKGNSIAILKLDDLYYLFHGDVTYTDEALRRKELSVVFEDKELAWETLGKVREFVENHPTVYLSTHTPEALQSLEEKKVFVL